MTSTLEPTKSQTRTGELYPVRYVSNFLIPLEDGTELAASGYFPDVAGSFPALLSCYPYHKDESFGWALSPANRYFAARGYISIVVDLAGTGSSSGAPRETTAGEGADCAAAVEWTAAQEWCDGNVGMWGLSYGAITSLSAAAAQPPHLRAIVSVHGMLDRYHDSFALGGCPKFHFPNMWGTTQLAHHLSPPMHQDPEGRWYRIWQERLAEPGEPLPRPWGEHITYDSSWDDKVINPARIKVPTFVIGGWRDLFADAAVRMYETIQAPRKLLMGPWLHEFPAYSPNAPVGHLGEMCSWFDKYLRGEDNEVGDEPTASYYVQGSGFWAKDSGGPAASPDSVTLFLGADGTLGDFSQQREGSLRYKADPTVGTRSGHEFPGGAPLDQGPDDLKSLTFTTEPLTRPLLIAGRAEATLQVAIEDSTDSNLVVKLCDVGPDGTSKLISTGWLKASHRDSHVHPAPVEPGRVYEIRVPIWATAYEVVAGHRLRLAFSCSDFPRVWPGEDNPTLRLQVGGGQPSSLRVPTAALTPNPENDPPPPDLSVPLPMPIEADADWGIGQQVLHNEASVNRSTWTVIPTPNGNRVETRVKSTTFVEAARPQGAHSETVTTVRLALPSGGEVLVEARSHVTRFGTAVSGRVERDGVVIFEKHWVR